MNSIRIPSLIAVPLWIGSALAVLGYTYLAFKETANGFESAAISVEGAINPLVASADVLSAELKPLNRETFKKSGQ